MTTYRLKPRASTRPSVLLKAAAVLMGALLLFLAFHFGAIGNFEAGGAAIGSRAMNMLSSVVMTIIALIIPLTSNLYSPKLVKVYVTHPLIIGGLSLLIAGHLALISVYYFPAHHVFILVANTAITVILLVALTGALPYLYSVSQFLRPTYFMPMLTAMGIRNLEELGRNNPDPQEVGNLIETVDVVTNIALTGLARGDRHLVILALSSLDTILTALIGSWGTGSHEWRTASPHFDTGLAQEGRDYLVREQLWPEAYVLTQILKINEMATRNQHEILAELAAHLVDTAQLAAVMQRAPVVDLHIMAFNTLLREVIEANDIRRFMSLSYNYRLLIEVFEDSPERMHEAARHLIHYGHLATRMGLAFGLETVIYDMGELILSLGRHNEAAAVELLLTWAGPLWQESIDQEGAVKKVAWRTLIRGHWEARAAGLDDLADALLWRYLSDPTIHREQLELLLDENRELHFEFNDRLLRFAHFSPKAEDLARAFTEEW